MAELLTYMKNKITALEDEIVSSRKAWICTKQNQERDMRVKLGELEEERNIYPRMRIHNLIDSGCEGCTKDYWHGGTELQRCIMCGVQHEGRSGDQCCHCTEGESPIWSDLQKHPDIVEMTKYMHLSEEQHQEELDELNTKLAYEKKILTFLTKHLSSLVI